MSRMQSIIIFCLLGVATSSYILVKEDKFIDDEEWQTWKIDYKKSYPDNGEEKVRYTIWKDNLKYIVEYNKNNSGVVLGMNQFGDMTLAEYQATMNGYFPRNVPDDGGSTYAPSNNSKVPDSVDWRLHGLVTHVKEQGKCGSCYAFSAVGAVEGQWAKKTGKLISLSEQQVVDCSGRYGNFGCDGGWLSAVFRYIKYSGGIQSASAYPYETRHAYCRFNKANVKAQITNYVNLQRANEGILKEALSTVGPISTAVDASHQSFMFYNRGVYYERRCSSTRVDHAVLLVGYGTEYGSDYWLVKNSWGSRWGQGGYIKMARNRNNNCGIATDASYPTV